MGMRKLRGKPLSSDSPSTSRKTTKRSVVSDEDDVGSLKLPTKKIEVAKKLESYSLCLYGEKGIGKTSLAGQFPNHLIFQFDPRRVNVSVRQVPGPGEDPLDWVTFKKYVKLLENRADSKQQTVVLDIIYRAYDLCLEYVCRKIGPNITHPSQMNDYGNTWRDIEREFENTIERIRRANCHLIIIAHASFKEVPLQTGSGFELLVPQSTKAVWNYLRALDFVFYYGYQGRDRILQVRGDDYVWAASGVEGTYFDPDGQPVRMYSIPDNAKEAYKILRDGFDNKVYGLEVEPEKDTEEDED